MTQCIVASLVTKGVRVRMISEALHSAHVAKLTSHASYYVEQRMAAKLISLNSSVTCLSSQIHVAMQISNEYTGQLSSPLFP